MLVMTPRGFVGGGVAQRELAAVLSPRVPGIEVYRERVEPVTGRIQQRAARDTHEPIRRGGNHGCQRDARVIACEGDARVCSSAGDAGGSKGDGPVGVGLLRVHLTLQPRGTANFGHGLDARAGRLPVLEKGDLVVVDAAHEGGEVIAGRYSFGRDTPVPASENPDAVGGTRLPGHRGVASRGIQRRIPGVALVGDVDGDVVRVRLRASGHLQGHGVAGLGLVVEVRAGAELASIGDAEIVPVPGLQRIGQGVVVGVRGREGTSDVGSECRVLGHGQRRRQVCVEFRSRRSGRTGQRSAQHQSTGQYDRKRTRTPRPIAPHGYPLAGMVLPLPRNVPHQDLRNPVRIVSVVLRCGQLKILHF